MEVTIIVILSIMTIILSLMMISLTIISSRMTRLEEDNENEKILDEWFVGIKSGNYDKNGKEL